MIEKPSTLLLARRALILDLDFTLLHLEWVAGAIEVPGRTRSAWVAPRTVELLEQLQAKFDLVLATARSLDGAKWVVDGLKTRGVEVAALVLEDGALWGSSQDLNAFEPEFEPDIWREKLAAESISPEFEWQTDFCACLVARCENAAEGELLLQKWGCAWREAGQTVRFFRDGRKVYALPARANKWSALQRLLGENALSAAGVGDGENDLIWLPQVAFPATFRGAAPNLVAAVEAKDGFVSELQGHEGIAEILRRHLRMASPKPGATRLDGRSSP